MAVIVPYWVQFCLRDSDPYPVPVPPQGRSSPARCLPNLLPSRSDPPPSQRCQSRWHPGSTRRRDDIALPTALPRTAQSTENGVFLCCCPYPDRPWDPAASPGKRRPSLEPAVRVECLVFAGGAAQALAPDSANGPGSELTRGSVLHQLGAASPP